MPEVDLMVFQSDNCPMICTYLSLDKGSNSELIDVINSKGMDYLLKEVIDKREGITEVEYKYTYTKNIA